MTIEEAQIILGAFREAYPEFLDPQETDVDFVVTVQVVADANHDPLIRVGLEHGHAKTELPLEFQINEFELDIGPASQVVPVEFVNRSRAEALGTTKSADEPAKKTDARLPEIRAGTAAQVGPNGPRGTFGWGFVIGEDAYALSNWHIFCPDGDETPHTTRIALDQQDVSQLAYFEPVHTVGNRWDLAIAKLDDPNMLVGAFPRSNVSHGEYKQSYPFELARPPMAANRRYYTVGRKYPHCKAGTLLGAASVTVNFEDGLSRVFERQLVYDMPEVDLGDSGSITVRCDTSRVAGLLFAKDDDGVYANPLYQKHWDFEGVYVTSRGSRLPIFRVDFAMQL